MQQHPPSMAADEPFRPIRSNLRAALWLEGVVLFSFAVGIAASLGLFAGGSTPTTPAVAEAYLVLGFVVTIGILVRTRQLLDAANRRDVAALKRLASRFLVPVAFVFSALLPAFMLAPAVGAIRALPEPR